MPNAGNPDAELAVKSRRFKCGECGAEQVFDAVSGKLKCGHCGNLREVPAEGSGEVIERDLFAGLATLPRGLGTGSVVKASRCDECGATVAFPEGNTAAKCTFCGSSRVLEQSESTQALRPNLLVPFAIDKKRAGEVFAAWIARLWFRPGDLKHMARVHEIAGVYVPFWTFDADVESSWQAEAGYHYYVEEEYQAQENGETVTRVRQVQHTRWEAAWGSRRDNFDDVLVCASRGLPEGLADKMATFETTQLVPYSAGYLAGWRAEEYAVDLQNGFNGAQRKMDAEQRSRCARDVPGDVHRGLLVENAYSAVTFKHVLLPVWVAAYRYHDKVFQFLVNGQTGEVVGKAPWSWLKITLFVLSLLVVILILASFAG